MEPCGFSKGSLKKTQEYKLKLNVEMFCNQIRSKRLTLFQLKQIAMT